MRKVERRLGSGCKNELRERWSYGGQAPEGSSERLSESSENGEAPELTEGYPSSTQSTTKPPRLGNLGNVEQDGDLTTINSESRHSSSRGLDTRQVPV